MWWALTVCSSCIDTFNSEAALLFEASSDSVSVDIDISLRLKSSATSHDLCVLAPESTSEIMFFTITEELSHIMNVEVRKNTQFVLNQVNASVEDVIIFRFLKFDLTLTQSTLKHSCNSSDSFNADFQTFKPWNQINKTVTFQVQNSNPAWFFCC